MTSSSSAWFTNPYCGTEGNRSVRDRLHAGRGPRARPPPRCFAPEPRPPRPGYSGSSLLKWGIAGAQRTPPRERRPSPSRSTPPPRLLPTPAHLSQLGGRPGGRRARHGGPEACTSHTGALSLPHPRGPPGAGKPRASAARPLPELRTPRRAAAPRPPLEAKAPAAPAAAPAFPRAPANGEAAPAAGAALPGPWGSHARGAAR